MMHEEIVILDIKHELKYLSNLCRDIKKICIADANEVTGNLWMGIVQCELVKIEELEVERSL